MAGLSEAAELGLDLLLFKENDRKVGLGFRGAIEFNENGAFIWTCLPTGDEFNFQQIDLLFFKGLYFYKDILITPQAGISGVKIKQMDRRFEGVGGKAGLETRWFFHPCFNLFGSFCGTLYYGRNNLHHDSFDEVRFASIMNLGIEYQIQRYRMTASWEGHWFPQGDLTINAGVLSFMVCF